MNVITFDICGQICPATLLIALKEINAQRQKLREGSVMLRFKTDNRDALVTIPESAKNMGYAVQVTKQEGCYLIDIGVGE